MGLFSRRAPTSSREFRAVTASGRKIDPNSTLDVRRVVEGRDPLEEECWRWYRSIGEVKFGARFMRNACSRVSLRLAVYPDEDTDPIVLTTAGERGLIDGVEPDGPAEYDEPVISVALAEAASELLSRMLDGQEREGALLGGWGAKSFVIGDAYLVGWEETETLEQIDPTATRDPSAPGNTAPVTREVWTVLSPVALVRNDAPNRDAGESLLAIRGYAGSKTLKPLPDDARVFRIWRPNEEWPDMADSLVRGVLLECEELYALGRSIKAVALSRLSAPILVIANEFSTGADVPTHDDSENPDDDPVTAAYYEHVTTPVNDTASVSSIGGLVLRAPLDVLGNGQASLKDAIFTVDATRKIDDKTVERCAYLISRIRAGLEFPTELYDGAGSVNHWGMWEINDNIYREFVQPTVREFSDQLVGKIIRPRLVASGFDPEEVARLTLVDDATGLIARPNRGTNVKDAHGALVISDAAAREAWGYDDGDAPSDLELERRTLVLTRGTIAPELMAEWFGTETADPSLPPPTGPPPALPAGPPSTGGGDTIPNEAGTTASLGRLTDEEASRLLVAAGRRRPAGARLGQIDARLLQRLTDASDVAVSRMVDRAGHRIVSTLAGIKNPDAVQSQARELIRHVPRDRVAAVLGRTRLEALSIDAETVLADNLEDLERKWVLWVREAQAQARRISTSSLDGMGPDEEAALEAKQDDHRSAAWLVLAASVLTVARSSLFETTSSSGAGPSGGPSGGRVPPGVVREALAKAGGSSPVTAPTGAVSDLKTGGPVGLVATGDDIEGLWGAHGKGWTEYEWVHDDPDHPFPWHEDLHGLRFATFDDEALSTAATDAPDFIGEFFYVGDHPGCLCIIEPVTDE